MVVAGVGIGNKLLGLGGCTLARGCCELGFEVEFEFGLGLGGCGVGVELVVGGVGVGRRLLGCI